MQKDIELRAQNEFKIRKIAHLGKVISKCNSVERMQTNKQAYNPYGNSPMDASCTAVTMAFKGKKRTTTA